MMSAGRNARRNAAAIAIMALSMLPACSGGDDFGGEDGRVTNFDECVDELVEAGETAIQAMQDCDKAWPNN